MENLFDLLDLGGNVWKKRIHDGLPRGVPALGCISPLLAYFGTGLTVSSRPIHRSLLAKYTIVTTPEVKGDFGKYIQNVKCEDSRHINM